MSGEHVTYQDISAAARAIDGAVVRTRCIYSRKLSAITGAEVWVKYENRQYTASFKDRGALNRLLALSDAERRRGVIAMSAGNHAQGVAYHAQRLGIPATIVMPEGTPNVKVHETEILGASVSLFGETLDDAREHAAALREREGLTLIHPYDDPAIVAGQGTILAEMLEEAPDLDTLVAPIGGGGLIAGNAVAARELRPGMQVIGVEAELYPSMYNVIKRQALPCGGVTLAEGIAVKSPGGLTARIISELVDDILLVSETEIERAVMLYLEQEKSVAEGAGAASLAALLHEPERFRGRKVGLILSGGNIDTRLLASLLMRGLIRDGRVASLRVEINDRPGALAKVAGVIAATQGNILEVMHQRMFHDVPAKLAELDVVVETRDAAHVEELVRRLSEAGYRASLLHHRAIGNPS